MNAQYTIFESARQARDPRFDGRFFVGVKTTGVYCRPICKVKMPRAENVTLYDTAAAAAEAGFRPCLRCRPESSPGTPAWAGTSTTVSRALRLIGEGALDDSNITTLSERLGVTQRHLSRLFQKYLGASPTTIAQTRRLQFAKKLIDETGLSMTEIALSSGYGSVRRFNDHFKNVYHRAPTSLRKRKIVGSQQGFSIQLYYRQPFDFENLLSFFEKRAIPGVERCTSSAYQRTIRLEDSIGRITIKNDVEKSCLECKVEIGNSRLLIRVVEKVRRLFDLDAVPDDIHSQLKRDKVLAKLIAVDPGQRLPGAWDSFEIAVRAIVGQQISVVGATTIMGRIAAEYGDNSEFGLIFPGPEILARIDPESLPMPKGRANAIILMSRAILDGALDLSHQNDAAGLVEQLIAIKGIGPWTAHYIAMRALNDPDAFLHSDLVLLRVAREKLNVLDEQGLLERAESWRPWRAYAGMYLWRHAN